MDSIQGRAAGFPSKRPGNAAPTAAGQFLGNAQQSERDCGAVSRHHAQTKVRLQAKGYRAARRPRIRITACCSASRACRVLVQDTSSPGVAAVVFAVAACPAPGHQHPCRCRPPRVWRWRTTRCWSTFAREAGRDARGGTGAPEHCDPGCRRHCRHCRRAKGIELSPHSRIFGNASCRAADLCSSGNNDTRGSPGRAAAFVRGSASHPY